MTFEEAHKELEQIVERLERGDAGVDELTKLWERGEELYRFCAAQLETVHGKIEERGNYFAFGKIAGCAEKNDCARIASTAVSRTGRTGLCSHAFSWGQAAG